MPSVSQKYSVAAPVEAVYAAWVSNDTVIPPVTRVDIDPVVGGHFRLRVGEGPESAQMQGTILVLEESLRIRYSWAWNGGHESYVDVEFVAAGSSTTVTVQHSGLADAEDVKRHAAGWDSYVAGLQAVL